ncbi:hypothetical protein MMC32_005002 [Xylographa parallela]|nr:hypothetical protein [Xylographa parallela]
MAAPKNPYAFETLPQEIRFEIYRYLLRTSHTIVCNAPRQRYEMHLAILRTNRAINTEAKLIMDENDFVAVRLHDTIDRLYPAIAAGIRRVPRFKELPCQARFQQALTISIVPFGYVVDDTFQGTTAIVTGPEGLDPVLEVFWRVFLWSGEIMLHLKTKSRRRAVGLLRPLLKMKRFESISFTGTVDEDHATDVIDLMTKVSRSSKGFIGIINDYVIQAEEAYVHGLYYLAGHKWNHVEAYCAYGPLTSKRSFAKAVEDQEHLLSSIVLKARLGMVNCYLRTEKYSMALAACDQALNKGIHLHPMPEEPFLLCAWIAYVLGDEHTCTWIHERHEAVSTRLHGENLEPNMVAYREALTDVFAIANVHGAMSCQSFEKYLTLLERNDGFGENGNETAKEIGND